MLFGAHMPTGGGVQTALERGAGIGCQSIQFFVKNNKQWFAKNTYTPEILEAYSTHLTTHKFAHVFGHAGYLINLASTPCAVRDNSLRSLLQEIELAGKLNLPFLVLHPGSHVGLSQAEGMSRIIEALNEIFSATPKSQVRIALENTAGQGTCLGAKIAHLSEIYQRVSQPRRLALCLDTAHFFAAGYDIRLPQGWDAAIGEVEDLIGLDQVLAFHLNDSKTDLGSRVDRHEHIGRGKIGLEAFRYLVNDQRFARHPGCLETPKSDDLHEDVMNLQILRSLVSEGPGGRRKNRGASVL